MSYSPLATPYPADPGNYSSWGPRNHIIDTITIHHMAGVGTAASCGGIFARPGRNGSSNYGIGNDGSIGCYVDESYRAWTSGSGANDNRAINIGVSNSSTGGDWPVSSSAMGALIALLVDVCYRNNIWELKWRGDRGLIGNVELQNMTVHQWFQPTTCPGPFLMEHMGMIAMEVNKQLRNITGFREKVAAAIITQGLQWGTASGTGSGGYSGGSGGSGGGTSLLPGSNTVYIGTGGGNYQRTVSTIQSSVIDYTDRLVCTQYRQRPEEISKITVHIAHQPGTLDNILELLNSADKAYNYGIDDMGKVGLFVEEHMMTYSTGSEVNDKVAVNIICTNQDDNRSSLTSACWNSLVLLCADICYRNEIEKLVYTNEPEVDTLTAHMQFQLGTNCPGSWLISKYHDLCEAANKYILMYRNSEINEGYIAALKGMNTIAIANSHPYVVRVDEGATNVDYDALKEIGVVGAMINAGQRYDSMHREVPYRSETVYDQAREAILSGVPFGFYYTTHARSIKEVREEAYWFYFVISKFPPNLGAWLHCEFDVGGDVAEELVERWYQFFVEWGLKSKCGLYCSRDQANLIGWPAQSTYMPLWLEQSPEVSAAPDEEILVPSYFSWMYTKDQRI